MKAPLSWLSEYIESKETIDAKTAERTFIQLGFEVEEILDYGKELTGPIVIGRVIEIVESNEFKKPIRFCQVDVGSENGGVRSIVCGASNFSEQDLVVVALPGAVLPGEFKISKRETYGKTSDGMICSLKELGIGDDHSGILVLDQSFTVGVDAITVLELRDTVFDLAVLPDRGYALSIRGLARELAIGTGNKFIDPAFDSSEISFSNAGITGKVLAPAECSQLVVTTLKNVSANLYTPWRLKKRLMLSGVRSISLAVDITNYIMLELGQPLHAFDQDKLSGEIQIRYAKSGEVLETLDHVKRTMDSNDLLVADNSRALSIAGIMGGLDSEVTENTKNIVIEAAHFAAQKVAETARRHILTSEASRRFERGVDPQLPIAASNLAVKYLVEFAGAEVVGRSTNSTDLPSAVIDLDLEKLHVIGGIEFTYEDVKRKLESIGCEVDSQSNIKVIAPSWRPDLLTQNDLAEEILRLTGYDQIPMVLPKAPAGTGFTKIQRYDRQLRQVLAAQGLSEILNYPFVGLVDSQFVANAKIGKEDLVFIANPLSDEKPFLRRSLLPGMFEAVSRNIGRGSLDLSLFEIGSIFKPSAASSSSFNDISSPPSMEQLRNLDNLIPVQSRSLVVFGSGKKVSDSPIVESHNWNWYEIIGLASSLFDLLHIPFESSAAEMAPWHPGRCAQFKIGDLIVGYAGELHPKAIEHFNLPTKSVALEINLDLLLEHATEVIQAKPIHTMPIAKEDLAVVVAGDIPVGNILHLVKKAAGDVLEQAEIFDVYGGNQVPAGQKSVAISMRFRASDRTLTSEEVAGYKEAILQELAKSIGAKIRE